VRTTVPKDCPIGIGRFDQRELPFAPPFLGQLLAGNGAFDGVVALDIDKPRVEHGATQVGAAETHPITAMRANFPCS
jgi:hypothetical protein